MPRMRTIAECARLIKADDPNTAITKNAIRSLVLSGSIPHVKIGAKRLIDYDQMLEILKNPPVQSDAQSDYGKIRRV